MKTTVSEKGQITIPKRLREQMGLHAGSVLEFSTEGGMLVARKKVGSDPARKWRGRGTLPVGGDVDEYLKRVRDADGR